jgi:hypothetical protein
MNRENWEELPCIATAGAFTEEIVLITKVDPKRLLGFPFILHPSASASASAFSFSLSFIHSIPLPFSLITFFSVTLCS